MSEPRIVDREEWLQERRQLLTREKALTKEVDRLSQARRALPWVRIDSAYTFEAPEGEVTLAGLFGGLSQLVVYHFMFGPDWQEGCVSCSFWADNFDGVQSHLAARDIAFAAISFAPLEKIMPFRERMGWQFRWVSSQGTSFNRDFHVSFGADHKADDPVDYNFTIRTFPSEEAQGISVFSKDEDGAVFHTYSAYGRGVEVINGAYAFMDMVPKGRDEGGRADALVASSRPLPAFQRLALPAGRQSVPYHAGRTTNRFCGLTGGTGVHIFRRRPRHVPEEGRYEST